MLAKTPIRGDERISITARLAAPPVRHVAMVIDPRSARAAHGEIARRLSQAGVQVSLAHGRQSDDLPSSIDLLLRLERTLTRSYGALGEKRSVDPGACPATGADLTLDFTGTAVPAGRTLRVLYDGVAGEHALMGALFAGRMPSIELQDAASGAIVSRGFPGTENADTIHAALEAVLGRLITLTLNTVRGWARASKPPRPSCGRRAPAHWRRSRRGRWRTRRCAGSIICAVTRRIGGCAGGSSTARISGTRNAVRHLVAGAARSRHALLCRPVSVHPPGPPLRLRRGSRSSHRQGRDLGCAVWRHGPERAGAHRCSRSPGTCPIRSCSNATGRSG